MNQKLISWILPLIPIGAVGLLVGPTIRQDLQIEDVSRDNNHVYVMTPKSTSFSTGRHYLMGVSDTERKTLENAADHFPEQEIRVSTRLLYPGEYEVTILDKEDRLPPLGMGIRDLIDKAGIDILYIQTKTEVGDSQKSSLAWDNQGTLEEALQYNWLYSE